MDARLDWHVRFTPGAAVALMVLSACAPLAAPTAVSTQAVFTPMATVSPGVTPSAKPTGGSTPELQATLISDKATFAATISPPAPMTPDMAPTGIYSDTTFAAHWAREGFHVQNEWFGLQDGNAATIFVGAYAADPAQGALKMVMILPDRTLQETHPTDTKHGALTVLAQTGN